MTSQRDPHDLLDTLTARREELARVKGRRLVGTATAADVASADYALRLAELAAEQAGLVTRTPSEPLDAA